MVYFIVQDEVKPAYVKIGSSNDPEGRLKSLSTGNPHKLRLWFAIPGGEKLESNLHAHFQNFHHRNEWYVFDDAFKHFMLSWLDFGEMGANTERPQPIFQVETLEFLGSIGGLGYGWMIDGDNTMSNRYRFESFDYDKGRRWGD